MVIDILNWDVVEGIVIEVDLFGFGNSFQLKIKSNIYISVFEVVGEMGVFVE